jgi:predicted transcriptional regulator
MPKTKLPKTSLEAHDKVTPEMLSDHYGKILKALGRLEQANYEQIAKYVNMDRHQVGRRLKEMERMNLIYKPGFTLPTSTGRSANVYMLCNPGEKRKTETEKMLPGDSVSDFSRRLVQNKLF